MIKLTQSLSHWLWEYHKDIVALVMFGHAELITPQMWNEYIDWCKTEEGKKYLKGGENYEADKEESEVRNE